MLGARLIDLRMRQAIDECLIDPGEILHYGACDLGAAAAAAEGACKKGDGPVADADEAIGTGPEQRPSGVLLRANLPASRTPRLAYA